MCHHRLPFGAKDQAKDLKQALLGRQLKHLLVFPKKIKNVYAFLLPPSPLPLGALGSPFPLVFLLIFFIEDNENLKHGGGGLSL